MCLEFIPTRKRERQHNYKVFKESFCYYGRTFHWGSANKSKKLKGFLVHFICSRGRHLGCFALSLWLCFLCCSFYVILLSFSFSFLEAFFVCECFGFCPPCPFVLMSHTHTHNFPFSEVSFQVWYLFYFQLEIRFSSSLLKKTTSRTWGLWRKSCWVQAQVIHR